MRDGNQTMDWELTPVGIGFCAVLGLALEILVLLISGIYISQVPLVVFGFLWFLSGMLVSGVLLLYAAYSSRGADGELCMNKTHFYPCAGYGEPYGQIPVAWVDLSLSDDYVGAERRLSRKAA
ncbi:MAG: hypothetical protein LUI07_09600 [Lachnospiraceae bacterium]|nr:hypothetical protein [Lachnospiraceae bacterium]